MSCKDMMPYLLLKLIEYELYYTSSSAMAEPFGVLKGKLII